jgi:D-alanine-D-alanine ligase
MKKIRVGILFGGRSAEHEVSLQSAKNIIEAIDKKKYSVVLIGIDKKGKWFLNEAAHFLLHADNPKLIKLNRAGTGVTLVPGSKGGKLISLSGGQSAGPVDVVFPVLHGPFGEDGTVQGFLKLANVPFVGASVLGSAIGMDKDVLKRLLRGAGIPTAKFLAFERKATRDIDFNAVVEQLGLPHFVKPANMGSSVGINKVKSESDFRHAVNEAFKYDTKILIEEAIAGRELECSVLGNDHAIASIPGEIVPHHEFYSYDAKYIDENGAALEIPAKLPEHIVKKVQDMAVRAFDALCCEGMARVDFFLRGEDEVIVNELNTIPGFTRISMYPKLWEASGIPVTELIDRLIKLAFERYEREQRLKTTVEM